MASSSHQRNEECNAFSGFEPAGKRRRVCESSRLYDVFINHRGHVKQTLATPLYNSLEQLGIRTFLDSQEKELGTSFPSTIETAISSAKVHIAIFSKGYAESAWCLAELVLMLQSNAKIIPLFYQVKPSDLRHIEKGVYAEAFIKYEKKGRYLEKLNEWKEALHFLSFIAGEEFESFSDTDCQKIVAAVQKEIQRKTCLHVADYPVGLNNLVEDFEKRCLDELVQDFENQCRQEEGKHQGKVVGIFGMGGVGKTTLAKELFNRKKMNYSRASFLFDVREASVSQLPSLQHQLLTDLFGKDPDFRYREEGIMHLKDHIGREPLLSFLIVVDGIDDVEQLHALRVMDILDKPCNRLVIVTARDVGVLITAGITVGYNLKGMDYNYGRELFCWHAFGQSHPRSGYEQLVDSFVKFCENLPLSLQVLGRHVHGRTEDYWNSELIKVSKMLPRDVKQRLTISFDALDFEEKQIFMDIACFFIDKSKSMSEKVWEGSRWNAHHALVTLKDKCLVEEIKIWFSNGEAIVLRMHDHLRDLGREFALELSPPHRLWRPQDLKSLESMGFKTILAKNNVRCFHSIVEESGASWVIFFVGQSDICFETSAYFLWFEGWAYKQVPTSIPSWIPLQNLYYLNIKGGQLETLWENNVQVPSQLKKLHISGTVLKQWPSLSGLSCLEKIKIESCDKLQNITLPTTLIKLTVRCCRHLQKVAATGDLTKPRELIMEECPELEELPSLCRGSSLENIEIDSCEQLQNITLPTTPIMLTVRSCWHLQRIAATGDLTKLRELIMEECPKLEELPSLCRGRCLKKIKIHSCGKLQNITLPTTLITLTVRYCWHLQRIEATGDLTKLRELIMEECPELEELPSLCRGSCLEKIEIERCEKLQNITLPTTLILMSVHRCRDLQRIAATGDLTKLRALIIERCPELEELPSLSRISCLESIEIDSCKKLQNITLPTTLIMVSVRRCRHLQRIAATGDLKKLRELIIKQCPELEELPSLSRISCLESIEICGCEKQQNISGIDELHVSEYMKLFYCSNAVIRNCILKLKSVPLFTLVMGRAVDGAESILNEYLGRAVDGADAVTQRFSQQDDYRIFFPLAIPNMSELNGVIVCMLAVFDDTTLPRSFYDSDSDSDSDADAFADADYTQGEWIITFIKCEGWREPPRGIFDGLGSLLSLRPRIIEGFQMELKKDEEWKSVGVLRTVIDRLQYL